MGSQDNFHMILQVLFSLARGHGQILKDGDRGRPKMWILPGDWVRGNFCQKISGNTSPVSHRYCRVPKARHMTLLILSCGGWGWYVRWLERVGTLTHNFPTIFWNWYANFTKLRILLVYMMIWRGIKNGTRVRVSMMTSSCFNWSYQKSALAKDYQKSSYKFLDHKGPINIYGKTESGT